MYILIRGLYNIWLVGTFVLFALAVGTTIFSKRKIKSRGSNLLKRVLMAFIWPVALLSKRGRRILLTNLEDGQ